MLLNILNIVLQLFLNVIAFDEGERNIKLASSLCVTRSRS